MKSLLLFISIVILASGVKIEVANQFNNSIWVGIVENNGKLPLANGGFVLKTGEARILTCPDDWTGTFWARTWCDLNTGHCQTGSCMNRVECKGAAGLGPSTLVEIFLKTETYNGVIDVYDISLVNGFNAKATIFPINGIGDCKPIQCTSNSIVENCPKELQLAGGNNNEKIVGCHSACFRLNTDQYCCRRQYGHPFSCDPNTWQVSSADLFKRHCPDAYSYNYDSEVKLFTCVADRYKIIFEDI